MYKERYLYGVKKHTRAIKSSVSNEWTSTSILENQLKHNQPVHYQHVFVLLAKYTRKKAANFDCTEQYSEWH